MMRFLFLFLFCGNLFAFNYQDFRPSIVKWEGYRAKVYKDHNGNKIIGIGHNLTANKQKIRKYSAREIEQFYIADLNKALETARRNVKNFDTLPQDAQFVTLSLIWTVGPNGFIKFKDYRNSLKRRYFVLASTALRDSLWFRQVQLDRAKNHYNLLKNIK